jgi:hypothetical protein
MKDKRFLILLVFSLVFILLFCDDIIEGTDETLDSTVEQTATGEDQTSVVDVTLTGTQSNDGSAGADMTASSGGSQDLTISNTDRVEGEGTDADGGADEEIQEVFGVDCVNNCSEYFHKCAYEREEEISTKGGRKTKVVAENFNRIENCPNGEIPERSCDDPEWGCKQCNEGYYRGKDNLCKPLPGLFSIFFSIIVLLILGGLGLFVYFRFLRFKGKAYALGAKDAGFTRI